MTATALWFIALGTFPVAVPPTMSFSVAAVVLGVALAVSALILVALADRPAHRAATRPRPSSARPQAQPRRSWAVSRCASLS